MNTPMLGLLLASVLASTPTTVSAVETEANLHMTRMVASLRASSSPRDQALATLLYTLQTYSDPREKAWRGPVLRRAAADAPNDRLVQWLWAVATPGMSGCDAAHPCPERPMALARLEPDNVTAWTPAGQEAWKQHDDAALDLLIENMAGATYNDELFVDAAVALNEVYKRYPIPATLMAARAATQTSEYGLAAEMDPESAGMISAIAIAAAIALPSMGVMQACDKAKNPRAASTRFESCARVGRTTLTKGRTYWSISMGTLVLKRSGNINADDIALIRKLRWRSQQAITLSKDFQSNVAGFREYFADLESTRSELRAQDLQLHRAGISMTPPEGWMPKDLAELKPGG